MILVDSSVWIDFFNGVDSPQVACLDDLLPRERIAVGDLILTEVLQGFGAQRDFDRARRMLEAFEFVVLGGRDIALQAARNFRRLRSLGITVRKTIDTVIATRCIESGFALLHDDRDFEPFTQHLGLRPAYDGA